MILALELIHRISGTLFFGGGGAPKAPPPPSPPPSETSADVAQETSTSRKRLAKGGHMSTILNQRVNPAEAGGKTLLGQ